MKNNKQPFAVKTEIVSTPLDEKGLEQLKAKFAQLHMVLQSDLDALEVLKAHHKSIEKTKYGDNIADLKKQCKDCYDAITAKTLKEEKELHGTPDYDKSEMVWIDPVSKEVVKVESFDKINSDLKERIDKSDPNQTSI